MRHLYGAALAVVLTAVMFFAGAWGYHELLDPTWYLVSRVRCQAGGGSLLSNSSALLALVAVVATGLLAGLLVISAGSRPSPRDFPGCCCSPGPPLRGERPARG